MVLNILKGKHPFYLIFVPAVAILLWIRPFINPRPVFSHEHQMPLYDLLVDVCAGNLVLLNVIAFFLLFVTAILLVYLNEEYVFLKQRTYLPALLFILISCGTVMLLGMHPVIPASLFLVVSMERLFGVYNSTKSISHSFDSGFLIGISSLFYMGSAVFLLWLWLSLFILGCLRVRELLSGLLGFITPFFFCFGWYFLSDQLPLFYKLLTVNLSRPAVFFQLTSIQSYHWMFLGALVLFSIFFMFISYEDKLTSSRKYLTSILWFLVLTVFGYFLLPSLGLEFYIIAAIPVTYFISHYFALQRHAWLGEVIFALFVIVSIVIHLLFW